MKATTFVLLFAVILGACAPAVTPAATPAQDPKALATELDALVQQDYEAGVFEGSVLVARHGEVILSKGYGFADRDQKTPNTPQSKYRIGSLTKQFTALAILMLQARGRLNVQDKLCTYIPNCPEIFQPITLHHLLTHTSGAPNGTQYNQPGDKMLSKYASLVFPPGEKWVYTDVGYNLAGKVIEAVSGQSYEAFMQQNVFEPLQMSSTGYDHQQPDIAKGYATAQGEIAQVNGDWYAAGALYSTVEDLYRYDQALYTDRLLPRSALSAMFTAQMPVPDGLGIPHPKGWGYGYGWFIGPDNEPRVWYHGGMASGYRTALWRYPDSQTTIIQLGNHEAVILVPTEEAIADKLLGN